LNIRYLADLITSVTIHEDKYLLVLNKPAGWVTLRLKNREISSLQDFVEKKFKIFVAGRAGIAHRLDKETNGLVLAAKTEKVFADLQRQFKKRQVKKVYWALVSGILEGKGKIFAPIKRTDNKKLKLTVGVSGRVAETKFKVLKNMVIDGKDFSLVEARPKTGRTHQIRVHFKYLGHPIFGDKLYGGKENFRRPMFLIAKEIAFTHPVINKKMKFRIDLPEKLREVISEQ
jgi:23S rRNA pseudouridine1911/1915/1917 synthase